MTTFEIIYLTFVGVDLVLHLIDTVVAILQNRADKKRDTDNNR